MNRRQLVGGLAAAATVLGATAAAAKSPKKKMKVKAAVPFTQEQKEVMKTTAACEAAGRICQSRCTDHLAAGMSSMEACQKSVMNMLSVCGAIAEVVAYHTTGKSELKALSTACAAFCRNCERECRAHAKHHVECADCMKACKACADACDALAKTV